MTLLAASSYDEALAFLEGRIDYERIATVPYSVRSFKLDRMRALLARLDRPQDGAPLVHVAGTKGKGSTAAMIAAVLTAAGYRTGLYSSPHLERIEERFRVDGAPCRADELIELVARVRPAVEALDRQGVDSQATYFEVTTAMAWLHFRRRKVDAVVAEVGLGGRLDSTNVCQPAVTAITSISFDHTRQLGGTLAEIAREKAGIVKPGVPLVCGVAEAEPRDVIAGICHERGAPRSQLGRDFDFRYEPPSCLEPGEASGRMDYTSSAGDHELRGVELRLAGRHQAANAAVAVTALRRLAERGWAIPARALREGLASVAWPARIEIVGRRPAIVVDSAHNVASVEALLATLRESLPARRRGLIFATSRDKDVRGMLERLLPCFDEAALTRFESNPRSAAPEDLLRIASDLGYSARCTTHESPRDAWLWARQRLAADDLLCATGSFFLAAEIGRMATARATSETV